jgi:DNA end-binding protein Ku
VPSAIWSGTIGFGLVSVPIKVVSATKSQDVRFNQLEEGTNARIRYRKVSDATGEEVPNDRIVKGYEVASGQYVVVQDEDLKALAPKASRTIEIEDFVDLDDIDPIFFENPYYLAPDPGAGKAYKLLVDAMTELRKVAVGRVVMRSKESLVAIRPLDGILCLETMRYADEINSIEGLMPEDVEEAEPTQRELDMAKQLVETLTTEFDPTKYHDEYREQLLGLIEAKQAGQEIVAEPMVEERGKVVDLMAALEASLSRAGRGGTPGESDEEELPPAAEAKSKPRKRGRKSA